MAKQIPLKLIDNGSGVGTLAEFSADDGVPLENVDGLQGALDGKQSSDATLSALANLNTSADKLIYATGPDSFAQADFPAQARTLVAANSQPNQRAALGLGSAAVAPIVGTVSQAGGTPTGAIIERGSNSSGSYTKWADGTMVCTHRFTRAGASGAFAQGWTYPAGFSAPPIVLATGGKTNGNGYLLTIGLENQPNSASCGLSMNNTGPTDDMYFYLFAIGRWFA